MPERNVRQVLEELFPGILDQLVLDGAHYLDGQDLSRVHYDLGGHLMVRTGSASSFAIYLATRPFLEEHVRTRLRSIRNVTVRVDHDIVGLTVTPNRGRVTGVAVPDLADGIAYRGVSRGYPRRY